MDLSKSVFPVAWKTRWLIITLSIFTLVLTHYENITKGKIIIPLSILVLYNIISKLFYKKSFGLGSAILRISLIPFLYHPLSLQQVE